MADPVVPGNAAPAASTKSEPSRGPIIFERHIPGAPQTAAPVEPKVEKPVAPQAPVVEKKPEAPAAAKAKLDAERFAAVARSQRRLQEQRAKQEREFGERESSLRALQAKLDTQQAEMQKRLDEIAAAKKNPMEWLKYGGLTYDQLAEQLLADGKVPPEKLVEQTRSELEAKLDAFRKEAEEKITAERAEREKLVAAEKERIAAHNREVVESFDRYALDKIRTNADKYELALAFKQEGEVPKLIKAYYEKTLSEDAEAAKREGRPAQGKLLTPEEAGELIEQNIVEQFELALKTKKIQAKYPALAAAVSQPVAPVASAAAPAATAKPEPQVERPTLTNHQASQPSAPVKSEFLTEEERMDRARAAWDAARASTRRQ